MNTLDFYKFIHYAFIIIILYILNPFIDNTIDIIGKIIVNLIKKFIKIIILINLMIIISVISIIFYHIINESIGIYVNNNLYI